MNISPKLWTSTPFSNVGIQRHHGEDISSKISTLPLAKDVRATEIKVGPTGSQSVAVRLMIQNQDKSAWFTTARHCVLTNNNLVPYVDVNAKQNAIDTNKYGRRARRSDGFFALHYHFDLLENFERRIRVPAFPFVTGVYDDFISTHTTFGTVTASELHEAFFKYAFAWLVKFDVTLDTALFIKLTQGGWKESWTWKPSISITQSIFHNELLKEDLLLMSSVIYENLNLLID